MRKLDELNDPKSCLSKANDNEMLFVLLGRDPAAPKIIRMWCAERVSLGLNTWDDDKIREAMDGAHQMEVDRDHEGRLTQPPQSADKARQGVLR